LCLVEFGGGCVETCVTFTETLVQGSFGPHGIAEAVMNVLLFRRDSRLENGGNWQ